MWESLAPNLHQAGLLEIGVGNLWGKINGCVGVSLKREL